MRDTTLEVLVAGVDLVPLEVILESFFFTFLEDFEDSS
jgi:hypothetical protein